MKDVIKGMKEQCLHLNLKEGRNETSIPYLTIYKNTKKRITIPEPGCPFFFLTVDGELRLHSVNGIADYCPGQYFVSAIVSPMHGWNISGKNQALTTLVIEFSVDDILSVIRNIDGNLSEKIFSNDYEPKSCAADEDGLLESIYRLLGLLNQPEVLLFMGEHMKQEIIFRVILSQFGKEFLHNIVGIQQAGEIYNSNSWIKANYRSDFSVEDLAKQRNMSVSSFHSKFKKAVGMGPMQCQKKLRLTEARRLMLEEDYSVTDAAIDVGYESVSQFIRDYGKSFGRPPKEDIQQLQIKLKEIGTLAEG